MDSSGSVGQPRTVATPPVAKGDNFQMQGGQQNSNLSPRVRHGDELGYLGTYNILATSRGNRVACRVLGTNGKGEFAPYIGRVSSSYDAHGPDSLTRDRDGASLTRRPTGSP